MKLFNVLGCCVSRDTLNVNSEKYQVLKYAAFISPYTMLNGQPLKFDIGVFDDFKLSGIQKRVINLDCKKSTFEFMSEGISDWLLLDAADSRFDVVIWQQQDIVLSYNGAIERTFEKLKLIAGEEEPKILHSWELPEQQFYENLDKVVDRILALYNPEQIIFNEFYTVPQYISKEGTLRSFTEATQNISAQRNEVMKKVNNYYKSRLKGGHFIKQPDNLLAWEGHRWGLYPLHYHDLYYEYAEKCVDIITQKLERSEEERQIEFLRKLYSEKFATLREKAAHKSAAFDRDKWKTYSTTFKYMIDNNLLEYAEDGKTFFESALLAKGHKRIAIYGDTEITKVLCKVLGRSTTVSIEYIVENSKKPVKGFKTIDRTPADYPDCDVMLVADIFRVKDIEAKLKKLQVPIPL